ncbi:hypothetical protein LGM89_03355 [Burkholderia sp. AU31624]|uniref:hypothetical protein n=1 Tax=Burkholderia sp. AU31624 TaxID=2879629 RepID=UPI001CF1D6FD|nr:hypothetical protein [Burkholderia sp. AU31624]MCA8252295.1 hypothetical protein [Burkholderia sp. AU31624]
MPDLRSFVWRTMAWRLNRVDIFRAREYCIAINHRDNRADIGIFTDAAIPVFF